MVVLELEGHNMLGSGPNQYLQPDYLSPLASPLDSKVSPLALLAQTCSQIGADGPSSKSIFETSKRKLSTCSESSIKSESSDSKDSVNNNSKEYSGSSGGGNNSHNNNSGGNGGSGSSRPKSSSSCSSLSGVNNTTSSSSSSNNKSSHNGGKSSPILSPNGHSPVFKPYEITKSSKETSSSEKHSERSSSKSKQHHHQRESLSSLSRGSANCSPKVKTPNSRSSPDNSKIESHSSEPKKSSSSSSGGGSSSDRSNTVEQSKPSPDNGAGSSPIIRSGLEVLQQGQFGSSSAAAEYNRKLSALHSLSALGGYPPGFDPLNPAFRPPFMGPPHPHAAHMGYALPGSSPYVSYSRVKTASGAETIVPVCKDPYCTGCQYGGGGAPHGASSGGQSTSNMNGLMAAAAAAAAAAGFPGFGGASSAAAQASLICPAGCVQCDHPKFPLSSFPHLFGLGGGGGSPHPSLASLGGYPSLSPLSAAAAQHSAAAAAQQQQNAQRPYVCNWIVGDNYCGKRFPSSEELLQHLRTHTNSSGSASSSSGADSAALAAMVQQQHQIALSQAAAGVSSSSALYSNALLNQSAMAAAAAAMHRTYPTPPLSPLSAARYHPYGKASGLGSPHPNSGSAAAAAAALSYYPYSAAAAAALYGQRLGPSVHQ